MYGKDECRGVYTMRGWDVGFDAAAMVEISADTENPRKIRDDTGIDLSITG